MIGRLISTGTRFSELECSALQSLRTQYQPEQHVFTAQELAHLRFLHWLVRSPGWNRALDQPYDTPQRYVLPLEIATWMPGFIG